MILARRYREKLCRLAFSLPFNGLCVIRQRQVTNEVPNDFYPLSAVSAVFVGSMDDNAFHKLVDDCWCEFLNTHVLTDNHCKTVKVGFVLFVSVHFLLDL